MLAKNYSHTTILIPYYNPVIISDYFKTTFFNKGRFIVSCVKKFHRPC